MKLLFIACMLMAGTAFGQTSVTENCSIMKSGTFKYTEAFDSTAYFIITDSTHTEYYGQGKYYIQSEIVWKNKCQYILKMTAITIPEFPFKPGDKMLVTIERIEGDMIYYTSEVNGDKWNTAVRKLK